MPINELSFISRSFNPSSSIFFSIFQISTNSSSAFKSKIDRENIYWHFPHYHGSLWKPGSAIRSGDWKLVLHYESNAAELFNLKDDPGELKDVSTLFKEEKEQLLNQLNKMKRETNANSVSINPKI